MLLEVTHKILGWPQPKQVLEPAGSGARIYAEQAKKKIGDVLSRSHPGLTVETGILTADVNSQNTEAPIAIVCQFPRGASDKVLDEAHQLAWNFSRTALLVTLEPHRLIAWSCCQNPTEKGRRRVCDLSTKDEGNTTACAGHNHNFLVQFQVHSCLTWLRLTQNISQDSDYKHVAKPISNYTGPWLSPIGAMSRTAGKSWHYLPSVYLQRLKKHRFPARAVWKIICFLR